MAGRGGSDVCDAVCRRDLCDRPDGADRLPATGDIVRIETYVYDAGETSVRVQLRGDREDPRTGEQAPLTRTQAVYVALDEAGDPTSVPELTVESEAGRELKQAVTDA